MATFWAKILYRNIVSELDFFKNQVTNYPSLVSRRKSTFEGLKIEEITPFRSLEDEYGTISGLLSFVWTSLETASHRDPGDPSRSLIISPVAQPMSSTA